MIPVEVCIHSENESAVLESVSAAWCGGASCIELCSDMANDGLTPPVSHIEVAREAFYDQMGLLVMIRPEAGSFFYSDDTIQLMEYQISEAANAGADGVVFGVLDTDTGQIDMESCRRLVGSAKDRGLKTTFHRAFDALSNWQRALDQLIDLEFDRVLTAGIAWGETGTAVDGLQHLELILGHAQESIEMVVGGINLQNVCEVSMRLMRVYPQFSIHTYSAVLENGLTSQGKVSLLRKQLANVNY
ncbi:MAG: copper homeostasis protein CutC [Endozoicomonas sp.]